MRITAMLAALAGTAVGANAQYSLQTLIYSGQMATNGPSPVTDCGAALIDPWGQTAATLNILGGDTRHVVRGMSHLATIVKEGQTAPGFSSGSVIDVGVLRGYTSDGEFAVSYRSSSGLWNIALGDPFSWEIGYAEGTAVPGHAPHAFESLPHTVLTGPDRRIAFGYKDPLFAGVFFAHLSPGGTALTDIIEVGELHPSGYRRTRAEVLAMNSQGRMLLEYVFQSPNGISSVRTLAFGTSGSPVQIQPIATSGFTAPGGGDFDEAAEPRGSMNDRGDAVFSWKVRGVSAAHDEGIWIHWAGSGLGEIMREGDAVPAQPGLTYGPPAGYAGDANRLRSAVIGGGRHVCFVARLQGAGVTSANDSALFTGFPGDIRMIAREGQPSGIGQPAWSDFFDADCNYWINVHGDVAFFANQVNNGEGVWHRTAGGAIYGRLASTGDTLPTGAQLRTVLRVADPATCSGGQDGRGSPLNDAGQVSFGVMFADNTHGMYRVTPPSWCYANCDESFGSPRLTANDFQCFLNRYAAGSTYANCDGNPSWPWLSANDFVCFLNAYAAGCS